MVDVGHCLLSPQRYQWLGRGRRRRGSDYCCEWVKVLAQCVATRKLIHCLKNCADEEEEWRMAVQIYWTGDTSRECHCLWSVHKVWLCNCHVSCCYPIYLIAWELFFLSVYQQKSSSPLIFKVSCSLQNNTELFWFIHQMRSSRAALLSLFRVSSFNWDIQTTNWTKALRI